ncbi:MAG: chemotaxis protein CheW [Anaerolineae bacterium]
MDEILIFRLGSSEWALPARKVRQVLPPALVTRLPGATPLVRGLVAWRARVLPVLALGARLGCSDPPADQSALLVVEAEGELVALAVDEVVRFAQARPSAACSESFGSAQDKPSRTAEQVEVEGRAVRLLDLEQVLNGE